MVTRDKAHDAAEAQAIVEAIRTLQTSPQLLDEARVDTPGVMDRLAVSGTVRHAVAAALALSIGGVALVPGTPVFWT